MAFPIQELQNRLWATADQLRANSELTSAEYKSPVLGLVFLRFADQKFSMAKEQLEAQQGGSSRRTIDKTDYQAKGVIYLPGEAQYSHLLHLPEGADLGRAVSDAMGAIENENLELRGILPRDYSRVTNPTLATLLRAFSEIPMDIEGDVFGRIYEYFLGKFAIAEGQRGGEFFTPTSLVKLIVEIIEPYSGRIFDPASGSAGMFVQSAEFVRRHQRNPSTDISIYGQENVAETVRLGKMSLAVHGLSGDIRQGNSYYEDTHESVGKFDFLMANPPFNVNGIDKERISDDPRFPFGMPRPDNGNYVWIQVFWSALNDSGRAGFVMANSASDARQSEMEIRKQIVDDGGVDVMVAIGSNFFVNVTLPCTLWFFDKGKRGTDRKDKVLFIDARNIFTQIDRAHREFTPAQIEFLANIVRLYRRQAIEDVMGSDELMLENFPDVVYQDVAGLCKVATLDEIREQGYSLNPGRYVGVALEEEDDFDFHERLTELNDELQGLNAEARELEERIGENMTVLLTD
ncbi:MAG: type I restriction enzyme M protein [Chloroflexi bacterium]|jgi:type I restriction enzyme M protein|nr:MAG: type I restriction enzyme M protein [Chloroflexota bacterium]